MREERVDGVARGGVGDDRMLDGLAKKSGPGRSRRRRKRGCAVVVPLLWLGLLGACSDETPSPSSSVPADAKPVAGHPAVEPTVPASPGRPSEEAATREVPLPTIPHPPMPARPEPVEERSPEELIEAGRAVYNANCIACHNLDPTQDGALGPAIAGSPLPLIEARVMRAEYPEGYSPKRPTRVMVPLPHLEPKLPELAAYLASLESSS